jgi:iron complex transport system substrate-binding protein
VKQTSTLLLLVSGIAVIAILARILGGNPPKVNFFPGGERGVPVDLPEPTDFTVDLQVDPAEANLGPRRIISLAPSITEMCFAMGLEDRLVGRTQYCKHPPAALRIPTVGALVDPNLELIVSLKPDLILVTTSSKIQFADRMETLGLVVKALPDSTLEEVYAAIRTLGAYTDRPKTAAVLVDRLSGELDRIAAAGPTFDVPPRVLIVTWAMPIPPTELWIAGPGSILDDLVQLAGYDNAIADIHKPWGAIGLEKILLSDPDIILESRDKLTPEIIEDVYAAWSAVGDLRAIRERRLRTMQQVDLLIPGPRVNLTLYHLIRTLSP